MARFKKTVVTILMVIVWFVTLVMVIPMKSGKGQLVTVLICLLINGGLAVYYSCIDHRPASFREWLKM